MKAELDAALLDRDEQRWHREVAVRTLSERLGRLRVADEGLCFGRTDHADGSRTYIGRIGLFDPADDYRPLLTDWRAPVARPFYTATGAHPEGLTRRRHYRTRGRRLDGFYDDELQLAGTGLLEAVNAPRADTMRDIVATIQAEQDEVIRLDHRGVLVIEGGPGTGKTAVALHRVAYLLYTQRERLSRQGVLVVGPNPGFLRYIGQVLPSLGETDVVFATPGELFPGVRATREDVPEVQGLKGGLSAVELLGEAIADRQELPEHPMPVELEDVTVHVDASAALAARDRARACGLRHNEARQVFHDALADALVAPAMALIGKDWSDLAGDVRRELGDSPDLREAVDALWPALTARRLLADLYEGRCFALGYPELYRSDGRAWTVSDVPLLDEAAEQLGTSGEAERLAERERAEAVEYARGVLEVIDTDQAMHEDELRAVDLVHAEWLADRHAFRDDRTVAERAAADREWTYGHVVVDEAQELSPMEWRVLMRRSPNRSMTVVGDLHQRQAEAGVRSWGDLLSPYVRDRWVYRRLTVNYRTPAAIMEYAAPALAELDPAAVLPASVRRGEPPVEMVVEDLEVVWRLRAESGTSAVIGFVEGALTPRDAKGLEFDTVVVVEPERFTAAERYVALTRATQRLVVVRLKS